jgi:hypothetical protein
VRRGAIGAAPGTVVDVGAARDSHRTSSSYPNRLSIIAELHEIGADTRTDEVVPRAAFPVVVHIQAERHLSKRIRPTRIELLIAPPERAAKAHARCDAVDCSCGTRT